MTTRWRYVGLITLNVLLAACGGSGPDDHGHEHADEAAEHAHGDTHSERASLVYTHYTSSTELFVEFPALVVGEASTFAAHFTRESDFKPLTSGTVSVLLERNGSVVASFRVREPVRTGIFSPVVTPREAGAFELAVTLENGTLNARHDLGTITVFSDASSVSIKQAEGEGNIGYLKEQQWTNPYAVTLATARPMRRSVPGFATVMAPADGGAEVHAPADGYLAASGLAAAGDFVDAGDVLGNLVPRLGEGFDVGSLLVALEKARAERSLAQDDVTRFEDLYTKGAIPERRLIEARRRLEVANAELGAARSRAEQYQRGSQQAGIALRAPVSGEIIESSVRPGAFVRDGDRLFRLATPDRRWLEIRVPERYAGSLPSATGAWLDQPGRQPVVLDGEHGARVVQIGSAIDPVTRTASVVIEYPANAGPTSVGTRLPASVFVSGPERRLAVPRSALIEDGGRMVVYVQTGGEMFVRRPIELGIFDGDFVEVIDGLDGGERIVSEGAYLVRLAAAGGDDIGHGHAH